MCGLYGIINNGPRPFKKDIFKALGIINDRRGGDSCGVFIDGKVEYGITKQALFENFFWDSELINNTDTCEIALGHDRKASVGAITVEKAHPILIKNDKGEVDFALVHNGTIYNYEALAKEYIPDIDCKGLSDSQVLALIIYHKGFDVLSKYNGGAAIVAVDYRKGHPRTFLFKGASKERAVDKEISYERPLHFYVSKEELIFSSIASMLCALCDDNRVYEAKDNKVYLYEKGKLYTYRDIDRSKCQQQKEIASYTYAYSGYNSYGSGYYSDKYINRNIQDNCYYEEVACKKRLHGKYIITNYGRIVKSESSDLTTYKIYFFHGIPYNNKFTFNTINKMYKKSKLPIDEFVNKNIISLRYWSTCPVFADGNIMVAAVSETGFVPFTGSLYTLGACKIHKYQFGVKTSEVYGNDYTTAFKAGGFV